MHNVYYVNLSFNLFTNNLSHKLTGLTIINLAPLKIIIAVFKIIILF